MDAIAQLKEGSITILVKPNAKKTEILGWDETKHAWRVAIASPAVENKANVEVVKFFSRLVGKQVRIRSGLRSKEKVLSCKA